MKKLLALTIALSTFTFSAWSQAPVINYDFGDKEAAFNPNPGASSTSFCLK